MYQFRILAEITLVVEGFKAHIIMDYYALFVIIRD